MPPGGNTASSDQERFPLNFFLTRNLYEDTSKMVSKYSLLSLKKKKKKKLTCLPWESIHWPASPYKGCQPVHPFYIHISPPCSLASKPQVLGKLLWWSAGTSFSFSIWQQIPTLVWDYTRAATPDLSVPAFSYRFYPKSVARSDSCSPSKDTSSICGSGGRGQI